MPKTKLRSPVELMDHLTIEQRRANVDRLEQACKNATHPTIKKTYQSELDKARKALNHRIGIHGVEIIAPPPAPAF
jgi:hypothetical protein